MSKLKTIFLILVSIFFLAILTLSLGGESENLEPDTIDEGVNREEKLPSDLSKVTPDTDENPPIVSSDEWKNPVPLSSTINTVGAEDSPFIPASGNYLYFFFTPDVRVPPENQLIDSVTGIWKSEQTEKGWKNPERVVLSEDVSLDGSPFILDNELWFSSIRSGNYKEADFYIAKLKDGEWSDWKNAGEQLNQKYDVGELHITSDGQTMYYGREEKGDPSGRDIYKLHKTENSWGNPTPLSQTVNTKKYNEGQPFLTPDGDELWFTGQSRSGYPGPAVFRSIKSENGWGKPQEIISRFAGEPTLDSEGNIYFVHHFFENGEMIEADIYIAEKN